MVMNNAPGGYTQLFQEVGPNVTTVHRYQSRLLWEGSTADGPARYDRSHGVLTPPSPQELRLSADAAFRGDATLWNPEALLVAAASSCQLLSFLALAAHDRVDVVSYSDEAEAVMPEDDPPMRLTRIVLRPTIVVAAGTDTDHVRVLVTRAHHGCYVANTLTCDITLEPSVELAPKVV